MDIPRRIAEELAVPSFKVEAAVRLLDEGATVPFIARYRKEATGGLDDIQLRALEERLRGLRALEDERTRVLRSIDEQGLLTEELRARIEAAETLARLEDLYLPFRPKRRTKAQIALEAGLGPLADALVAHPERDPADQAAGFVSAERGVASSSAALEGAREILMQRLAEDADLAEQLRAHLRRHGVVRARVREGKEQEGARFRDYFAYDEPLGRLPSHRALALFRGRNEGVLGVELRDGDPEGTAQAVVTARLGARDAGRPGDPWLLETARLAWRVKGLVRAELALLTELRQRAEADAIGVFAKNLRELLLAAPAGQHTTMGLDPGIRTGVKVAVVDGTGRVLDTATVYPFQPRNDEAGALRELERLCRAHAVARIAIGNGTASRETDRLAGKLLERLGDPNLLKVTVSEAGASVYSASELASAELPDLDVSLRGAVSIARRLQDPLAELVRIDPRAIGVGQYQHDVDPGDLGRALDAVVEDCVNAVGVELNTASPSLLQRVAGLSPSLARAIVAWRDSHGGFRDRKQLLEVPRLGPRTFEQCAGFLRIRGGENPLDASAVHPEAYPVVQRILAHTRKSLSDLMGHADALRGLRPQELTDARFGLPTVQDILAELEKPGRDPRPAFRAAQFKDGIETLADLKVGMVLEGVVTNVTDFGAFVDVGVHQDGLVHISQLADRFVKDPHTVVRPGQIVTVRVVEVDPARKRIALTMRSGEVPRPQGPRPAPPQVAPPRERAPQAPFNPVFGKLRG